MTMTRPQPPAGAVEAASQSPPRAAAVLALARAEARELHLQVPLVVMFALYVGHTGWKMFHDTGGEDAYPVLQEADRATQGATVLVAFAVLACVHRAMLRSRKHGTEQHFAVLVVEPWRRTVAHALSAVPVALATAAVVAVEFGWNALKPGAVGRGSLFELAVGPLTVMLCAALAVLIARILPFSFGVVVFAVGLYTVTTYSPALGAVRGVDWLAPLAPDLGGDPVPSYLLSRSPGWHALYLAGFAASLVCGAALLSGGRTPMLKTVTAIALAATAVGIARQAPDTPSPLRSAREAAATAPAELQECVTRGATTYCAFPEWTGRTADWAAVVDRVRRPAGGAAGGRALTVRQRVDARAGLGSDSGLAPSKTPGEATVGTRWGGNRIPEFAVGVASVLVTGDERAAAELCDARVVTVMWLALNGEPDPRQALRDVRPDDSDSGTAPVLTPTEGLVMTTEQTRIVRTLLDRPRFGVTARVKAHWSELTDRRTPLARVAELLDIPPAKKGSAGAGEERQCAS